MQTEDPRPPPESEARGAGDVPVVILIVLVLALGCGASLVWFVTSRANEQTRIENHFSADSAVFVSALRVRFGDTVDILGSLAAWYEISPLPERESFRTFAARLFEDHPGIHAMEWIPRVEQSERRDHEAAARAHWIPTYSIVECCVEERLTPAGARAEYFPVFFVEPYEGNEAAVGFDLGSSPVRATALERARSSGLTVSTGRVRLVQEQEEQYGVLLLRPVYAGGAAPETVSQRRAALRGFVLLVLRMGDLVDTAVADFGAKDMNVAIFDESAASEESFLHRYSPTHGSAARPSSAAGQNATFRQTVEMATRTWRIETTPVAGSLAAQRTLLPWGILVIGFGASLLLSGVVLLGLIRIRQTRRHADAILATNVALTRQMKERETAELALRSSEERFRTICENAPVMIDQFAPDGSCLLWNNECIRRLGWTADEISACEDPLSLFYPDPDVRNEVLATIIAADGVFRQYQVVAKDGSIRAQLWANFQLPNSPVIAVGHDITEQVRSDEEKNELAEKMRHAQKLESLGVLAGGVAHDFNNLLMGVLGNADLAIHELPTGSNLLAPLSGIVSAAERAADLSRQMLAYSGRASFVVEPVELSGLARDMEALVRASISKKATLEYQLAAGCPAVEADATQLHQVVFNLIINASEAFGDDNGRITVATGVTNCSRGELAATYVDDHLPAGNYVFVEVRDDGAGMDADTARRIFEPFYTTKFTGRGLGLAAALGIVRGHRGAITVDSEPGVGTTFRLLLPVSVREVPLAQTEPKSTKLRGSGLVLIVDDEQIVRDVASAMVGRLGFEVVTAINGELALEVFAERRDDLVAVILDRTMPVLDGVETLREIRRLDPDMPVVLSSGYSDTVDDHADTCVRLSKPYTLQTLERTLRLALGEVG